MVKVQIQTYKNVCNTSPDVNSDVDVTLSTVSGKLLLAPADRATLHSFALFDHTSYSELKTKKRWTLLQLVESNTF